VPLFCIKLYGYIANINVVPLFCIKLYEYIANINVVPLFCIKQLDKFPVQNSMKKEEALPSMPFSFASE
jgi:hypothetical protein